MKQFCKECMWTGDEEELILDPTTSNLLCPDCNEHEFLIDKYEIT